MELAWSLLRYRFAASRQPVDPGTARSIRNRSASLPVFTMPSSVSSAAEEVSSQSGHGRGPRSVGVAADQVDQRWSSPGSNVGS